jgi:hypothetical protein
VRNALGPDPPGDAPETLSRAWPLVLRWGESDDVGRSDLVEAASDGELSALIDAVTPLYPE